MYFANMSLIKYIRSHMHTRTGTLHVRTYTGPSICIACCIPFSGIHHTFPLPRWSPVPYGLPRVVGRPCFKWSWLLIIYTNIFNRRWWIGDDINFRLRKSFMPRALSSSLAFAPVIRFLDLGGQTRGVLLLLFPCMRGRRRNLWGRISVCFKDLKIWCPPKSWIRAYFILHPHTCFDGVCCQALAIGDK